MKHSVDKLNQLICDAARTNSKARILLWLDENISANELQLEAVKTQLDVVSNRIDDIQHLQNIVNLAEFSDFKSPRVKYKYEHIFYRISKERLVTHHCINQSVKLLKSKGTLTLVGRKEDGIKTYFNQCKKVLSAEGELKKDKSYYSTTLTFPKSEHREPLDDKKYKEIREVASASMNRTEYTIFSKPGVYGWKKIDSGSAFLADILSERIVKLGINKQTQALDLGCGSGYLSLALSAIGVQKITATDNNAAAIAATKRTLKENAIKASVIASNAGDDLDGRFDLIISNPPFHKGFETDTAISDHFVMACKKLLRSSGTAYFVCNAFVGVEKPLFERGFAAKQIANNRQFKVLEINHR